MAQDEKTYLLTHSPQGFKLLLDRDSPQSLAEVGKFAKPPDLSVIETPRWGHWYQRKLARPWQATLLGMNIEPTSSARRALQAHDADRFQIYEDRLDIVKTLIGYEIPFLEDHLREGEGAGNKYLELVDYYEYATKSQWPGLEGMRAGLKLDEAPPTLNIAQRQVNNYLAMLDIFFHDRIANYFTEKGKRSPAAVLEWFSKNEVECPVSEPTLRTWLAEMVDGKGKKKSKKQ